MKCTRARGASHVPLFGKGLNEISGNRIFGECAYDYGTRNVFKEVASQEYYNIPCASFKYCENYREISLPPLLASDKLAADAEIEWKILLLYCYRREGGAV